MELLGICKKNGSLCISCVQKYTAMKRKVRKIKGKDRRWEPSLCDNSLVMTQTNADESRYYPRQLSIYFPL